MLGIPAATPFDLNFRLLGIPVRVSPWFWLMAVMINLPAEGEVRTLLIWICCVFASILIHEFGHGLMARYFGYRAEVVLYSMGGLCSSESERQTPGQRLAVLFMGPGAQFLLLGGILLFGFVVWGVGWRADLLLGRLIFGFPPKPGVGIDAGAIELAAAIPRMGGTGFMVFTDLFQINLLWPLLNLLPIWPLDGGQITHVLLTKADRVHGPRRTHIVSMVTAGALTAYVATRMGGAGDRNGIFLVIFFGMFALMNYQALQAHHQHYVENGPDDADWWKK